MFLRTVAFVLAATLSACAGFGSPPMAHVASADIVPSSSSKYMSLYSFVGGDQGANPSGGLILFDGSLGGVIDENGSDCGFVYRMSTAGANHIVSRFDCGDRGQYPESSLVALNGKLYGTTAQGGSTDNGVVFSLTKSGQEKVIYNFRAHNDARSPEGNLIAVKGTLYGITSADSLNGYGTVFSVTTAGKERVLYVFKGGSQDGNAPVGIVASKNTLYGVTYWGGTSNDGTVFSLTISGKNERIIHNFGGAPSDGAYPNAAPIAWNGALYGTTFSGGSSGSGNHDGTIFEVTTAGKERVFHSFSGADGWNPYTALIVFNGALYGTTLQGGSAGYGTAFRITASGKETVLHSFATAPYDGTFPESPLTAVGNNLYGTAESGGLKYLGTFYRIVP